MKTSVVKINVPFNQPIRIYCTGDWHRGNCNSDTEAAIRLANIIKKDMDENPFVWIISMGDLFDLIVHSDTKRFMPATIDPRYKTADLADIPMVQMDDAEEIFGKIMHRTIACVSGNHEGEYKKRHHFDIHDAFFRRFPLPNDVCYTRGGRDLGYVGFMKLQIKLNKTMNVPVEFCINHGDGGGGFREGYPINKLYDVFRWCESDYALMGHIHQLKTDSKLHPGMAIDGTFTERLKWKGLTGCLLRTLVDGRANYFEHKGRCPSGIGCLVVEMVFYSRRINGRKELIKDLRLKEINLDHPEWKYS